MGGRPAPAVKTAAATVERSHLRVLPDNGERKIVALSNLRETDDKDAYPYGGFTGYVSVFGNVDSYGDIVTKGAYGKTLAAFIKDGFIAWNHNWQAEPIGTVRASHEDDIGLYIDVEFHSTDAAQNIRKIVAERLARGKTMGLSIGYTVDECDFRDDGVRILKSINLFEGSLVNLPANRIAQVTEAKKLQLLGRIAAKETPFDEDGDDFDPEAGDEGSELEDEGPVEGDPGDPDSIEPFGDSESYEGDEDPESASRQISFETKLSSIKSFGGLCTYAYLHPDRKAEVLTALGKRRHGHERKAGKYDQQCPRCRFAADLMHALGQPDPVLTERTTRTAEHTHRERKSMKLTAEQRTALLKTFGLTSEATDESIDAVLAATRGEPADDLRDAEGKAEWDTAYINDLPDSAFAVILPGGSKDEDGKTTPRSLRKFPHHKADGSLDLPHLRNALARLTHATIPEAQRSKAESHLERHATAENIGDRGNGKDDEHTTEHGDAKALPEAAFGYVGRKNGQAVRLFQHHDDKGAVSADLLRQALTDLTSSDEIPDAVKTLVREHLHRHAEESGIDEALDDDGYVPDHFEDAAHTLAAEGDHTLARVDAFLSRARAATELRAKEGRPLSSNNRLRLRSQRQRLAEVLDELDKLLSETDREKPVKLPKTDLTEVQHKVRQQANAALAAAAEAHVGVPEGEAGEPEPKGIAVARALIDSALSAIEAVEDGVAHISITLRPTTDSNGKSVPVESDVQTPPRTLLEALQSARTVARTTRLILTEQPDADTLSEALQQQIAEAADSLATLKDQVDDWATGDKSANGNDRARAIRDLELESMVVMARASGL